MSHSQQNTPTKRQHRRYERVEAQMDVFYTKDDEVLQFKTQDVSLSGLMIQGGKTLPSGQLLGIRVDLDDGFEPLSLFVMAVRHIPPRDELPEGGVGMVLYANGDEATKRWHTAVRRWGDAPKPKPVLTKQVTTPKAPQKEHNAHIGTRRKQSIPFETADSLKYFAKRILKQGRFRMQLKDKTPENAEVQIILVHPKTQDRFSLFTTITQVNGNMAVANLTPWDRPTQQKLVDFVNQGRVAKT